MNNKLMFNKGLIRKELLEFLQWNDKNGTYTDENCIESDIAILTYEESFIFFAVELYRDMLFRDIDNALEITYEEVLNRLTKSKKLDTILLIINQLVSSIDKQQEYKKIINNI